MGNRVVPLFSKFLYINISLFHEPMIQSVIAFISKRDIEVLYLFWCLGFVLLLNGFISTRQIHYRF